MFGITDKYTSENKLDLTIVKRDFGSTAVWIGFDKGSFNQDSSKIGVAHFAEHMLLKESEKYPDTTELYSELMAKGVTWNAQTELFSSSIKINVPDSQDLKHVLENFFDKVFNPSLLEKTIEKERSAIITELRSRKQELSGYSSLLLHNSILGVNNTEWTYTGGDEKVISNLKRADIQEYVKRNYIPSNMRIGIVGNVDIQEIISFIEDTVIAVSKSSKHSAKDDIPSLKNPVPLMLEQAEKSSGLKIMQEAYPVKIRTPSDAAAFLLLRSYLSGSRSSYLPNILRVQKGLVYGVQSWSIYGPLLDFLCLSYEVSTEKHGEFIKQKQAIYSDLVAGKIDSKLFEATKSYRQKVVNKWFESSDLLLEHWMAYKVASKPFGYDEVYEATEEMTLEDFTSFATGVFQNKKIGSVES